MLPSGLPVHHHGENIGEVATFGGHHHSAVFASYLRDPLALAALGLHILFDRNGAVGLEPPNLLTGALQSLEFVLMGAVAGVERIAGGVDARSDDFSSLDHLGLR